MTFHARQEEALREFLLGDIGFDELRNALRDYVTFDVEGLPATIHWRADLDAHVTMTPAAVIPMLRRYLNGAVTTHELVRWANVVVMMTEFGPHPSWTDEEGDLLEPVWDILQQLSTPIIFQPVTAELVREFLARLEHLAHRLKLPAP